MNQITRVEQERFSLLDVVLCVEWKSAFDILNKTCVKALLSYRWSRNDQGKNKNRVEARKYQEEEKSKLYNFLLVFLPVCERIKTEVHFAAFNDLILTGTNNLHAHDPSRHTHDVNESREKQ